MKRLLATLALLSGLVWAQPLAALAPADTALSLEWSFSGERFDTLPDDLAALPWQEGKAALAKLLALLAQGESDQGMAQLWRGWAERFAAPESARAPGMVGLPGMAELAAACPAAADTLATPRERGPLGTPSEGLLSVSLSTFSPIPAVTLLLRPDAETAERLANLEGALLACAEADPELGLTRLEQDGTALFVLGDGGDFPVVVGQREGLFLFGSNPEVLRGVLRRQGGASEGSLAESPLYRAAQARFAASDDRLGLTLDFAALARAAESFGGMVSGEGERYLVTRGVATLRTLGGFAARLGASDEGLLRETLLAPDAEGGDEALLALLRCQGCAVSSPRLAPEGLTALSVSYLPYRELWAYLEDWLRGYAAASGESLDLKAMLEAEFGFDLDVALFDWLGGELHAYALEPLGPDLRTLLYQPGQVLALPVSSPEAARAGFTEWGRILGPLWRMALSDTGADAGARDALGEGFDVRETSYQDVALTRVRFGPNLDLAYGFLGNYLVVGTPAAALEPVIDTYQGARGFVDSAAYRALRAESPAGATGLRYRDDAAQLRGLADLLGTFAQPAAFAAQLGLAEWQGQLAGGEDEQAAFSSYPADLEGAAALPLGPGETQGRLEAPVSTNADYYDLAGLEPGERLTVTLTSADFDTYLALLDPETGDYLLVNDDLEGGSTDSGFTFEVGENARYWLEVNSFSGAGGGAYELQLGPAETGAAAEPLYEPGSYGYSADVFGATPAPLAVPGSASGELAAPAPAAGKVRFYELGGVAPGDEVAVTVRSSDFDTYLSLIDADQSLYLNEDDDGGGGSDSALTFTVQPGVRYWLAVGSYGGQGAGEYTLTVSAQTAAERAVPSPAELPRYGELLDLFGLLPRALSVLADHLSTTSGYTVQDEQGVYGRSLTRLRW